jgi:hypothetical protein
MTTIAYAKHERGPQVVVDHFVWLDNPYKSEPGQPKGWALNSSKWYLTEDQKTLFIGVGDISMLIWMMRCWMRKEFTPFKKPITDPEILVVFDRDNPPITLSLAHWGNEPMPLVDPVVQAWGTFGPQMQEQLEHNSDLDAAFKAVQCQYPNDLGNGYDLHTWDADKGIWVCTVVPSLPGS